MPVDIVASRGCSRRKHWLWQWQSAKKQDDFFTSGSREADQRASQRMARDQQLSDSQGGTQSGDRSKSDDSTAAEGKPVQAEGKRTLFDRLGGEQGITAIVEDFTARALEDPRVNWERKGLKRGGLLGRDDSVSWNPNAQNVSTLKKHLIQFLALATGGPAQYDGKDIRSSHAGMRISNPEFDAAIGDLKASLDKLRIPDKEQKELLAIVESTRPQIVSVR